MVHALIRAAILLTDPQLSLQEYGDNDVAPYFNSDTEFTLNYLEVIVHFAHYFQSCPAIKTDEIGAKTRVLIVIAIVGMPFKIVYEEISRFFQFVHI